MGLNLNYTADVLVSTEDMQEETWLQYRRNGIGGSDAAAVIGLSPYKTARDVYFEKLGREPEDNNTSGWVAMEVGKRLEDLVAAIFAKKTGFRIWQEKVMYRHPLFPFMLADVDYFFETSDGTVGILECKTANIHTKEKWENDAVPYHYEVQCRHYMAVKNLLLYPTYGKDRIAMTFHIPKPPSGSVRLLLFLCLDQIFEVFLPGIDIHPLLVSFPCPEQIGVNPYEFCERLFLQAKTLSILSYHFSLPFI